MNIPTTVTFSTELTPLKFANRLVSKLPSDKATENFCRQVEGAAFSYVMPVRVKKPELLAYTKSIANDIGFSLKDLSRSDFSEVFTGNKLMPGMSPYATCYGGHQFGNWAGQLGDGRAINLGEVYSTNNGHLTLQLKGAGPTPYSRNADGFAVLRSSIREFLCSEAMFNLDIATTRALSICLTGEKTPRDMFYNGNVKYEARAVVCRVTRSFTRFGSFQLASSRGDVDLLKTLVDYCINADFPHLGLPSRSTYLNWFAEISDLTCDLIVNWMRVGFVHGVMNTDNMSIIGETIDYGPYGWIDNFDPGWTPNTTDAENKRYCFGNQSDVALWNLFQLANAIYPLIGETEPLEAILRQYQSSYKKRWSDMMAQKLGFIENREDFELFTELESILESIETDMTIFYRKLASLPLDINLATNNGWFTHIEECFYQPDQLDNTYKSRFSAWLVKYIKRSMTDNQSSADRTKRMNRVNPKYVLRNYLTQQAIDDAENGDYKMIHELQEVLLKPYDEQPDKQHFASKRPNWAKHKAGCSMLSCSS